MLRKLEKFFTQNIFLTSLIITFWILIIKLLIPEKYQILEVNSIYWSVLSSVIFIYWFILSSSIGEYKEAEKIMTEIKTALKNLRNDWIYYKWLNQKFDLDSYNSNLVWWTKTFFDYIADNKPDWHHQYFINLQNDLLNWEKNWITPNHIIKSKNDISTIIKNYSRLKQIKEKSAMPHVIYNLKNFITFLVIIILVFLNMWDEWKTFIHEIEESIMLFIFSFMYIYLSFIINSFDHPFDKRRFSGYIDIDFLRRFYLSIIDWKQIF